MQVVVTLLLTRLNRIIMPVKITKYPNKGVWLDPRIITSIIMPESLCILKGEIKYIFKDLLSEGYCTPNEISYNKENIYNLEPFNVTDNKMDSSFTFETTNYLFEFFRTSKYNYKVYALKR